MQLHNPLTPLQRISKYVNTIYAERCDHVLCPLEKLHLNDANKVAAQSDVTILIVGSNRSVEEESRQWRSFIQLFWVVAPS
jgi:hypothetical protein